MNRVSKIFCIVGLVAVIGGSITLGVGMAQGGVFRRFTKAEKKTKQFVINEENLKNNKVVLEDIEIIKKAEKDFMENVQKRHRPGLILPSL